MTEIVGAVARMSLVPVFAKVPGGLDVVPIAIAAARAGASVLTLTGSPPAYAVDASSSRPILGGGSGWLSGPALKPLTLRAIADVARALPRMPLVASGGIGTAVDAIEAMIAGATAVQVGVAALIDPTVARVDRARHRGGAEAAVAGLADAAARPVPQDSEVPT